MRNRPEDLEDPTLSVLCSSLDHLALFTSPMAGVCRAPYVAAGMYRTLMDQGAAVALLRALLECANGVMPPNLVTDVAAAMFSAWIAMGDDTFAPLLLTALAGRKTQRNPHPSHVSPDGTTLHCVPGRRRESNISIDYLYPSEPKDSVRRVTLLGPRVHLCVSAFEH